MPQSTNLSPKHSSHQGAPSKRLHCDQALSAGVTVTLSEDDAHYLGRVLRLQAGAEIGLFNGRDGEWRSEIVEISKKAARLDVTERIRAAEPCPPLTLAFAPIRNERLGWLVEKAAELGVTALVPVMTQYCQNRHPKLAKLEKIAAEAAEQCERLDLPTVAEPVSFSEFLEATPRMICAIERVDAKPMQTLAGEDLAAPVLFIGPEGGFSPAEQNRLIGDPNKVQAVTLGKRLLRAETAAIAGLTLLQSLRGEMDLSPSDSPPS